jgi:uncharacterized protein YfaP (DUF2135 family)
MVGTRFGLATALALMLSAPAEGALHLDAPVEGVSTAEGAKAEAKTGLELRITPGDVEIFINGKRRGLASEVDFVATGPGRHAIRLVRGGDEFEAEIPVSKGQIVEFSYQFE